MTSESIELDNRPKSEKEERGEETEVGSWSFSTKRTVRSSHIRCITDFLRTSCNKERALELLLFVLRFSFQTCAHPTHSCHNPRVVYYNGDNGVGPPNYTQILFQSLATAAGYDPLKGLGSSCRAPDASGQCVLPWAGGVKAVSSVVLIGNGVSFAVRHFSILSWNDERKRASTGRIQVMTLVFTIVGAADYGTFGRWILPVATLTCWGSQYSTLSLTSRSLPNLHLHFNFINHDSPVQPLRGGHSPWPFSSSASYPTAPR